MKITASRFDEIAKQRDEYDAEIKKLKDKEQEGTDRYKLEFANLRKSLEQKVADIIGSTTLDLEIRVDRSYSLYEVEGWSIRVNANEKRKFDENTALSWSWQIELDKEGEYKKDSSSWSGLRAITPEQIADLEESVRIIKILNNTDWSEIINAPTVHVTDYIDREARQALLDKQYDRPKFEEEMKAAKLEELVGTDTAIKLTSDEYYRGPVWILVTGLTDKFVKGYIFPQYYADQGYTVEEIKSKVDERRAAKHKIESDANGSILTMDIPFV